MEAAEGGAGQLLQLLVGPHMQNLLVHRPQTNSDATRMQNNALPRPVRVVI